VDMGAIAKRILAQFPEDYYTIGRGQTLQPMFLGHLEAPVGDRKWPLLMLQMSVCRCRIAS
jgi:hypothetical protein